MILNDSKSSIAGCKKKFVERKQKKDMIAK